MIVRSIRAQDHLKHGWSTHAIACAIILAAGIARSEDDSAPRPRSPAEEQATFQLADPQLTIELVAAEPEVISPVAMCWDAHGALFVAEMRDYPVGPKSGTIRRLVDRDNDGRYESATIFADQLNFPNGLLATGGGLLVTAAPDLLLLRDTDGDGVADERRVIFTGFAEGNQQLRANGLGWGLDNWIYGANGRSDGQVRRPDQPVEQGVSIRTRDFRFRPDFSRFEAVIGQSQFGQSRDDAGRRFLSWNTMPVRQQLFDETDLSRNPQLAHWAVYNLVDPGDAAEVFPIAPRPQTFNRESTNHFNALAGLTIYRGDNLGDAYYGNALVGESLSGLVHRRRLIPHGPTFTAERAEAGREFLASTDNWFHPVFLTTGPDGCLYLADFYRRWVEHPQFVAGQWREKVEWREGFQHGRIWRLRRHDRPRTTSANLAAASVAELVAELASPNAWRRDTAQRLLVESGDKSAVPLLKQSAGGHDPRAAVCALWTLDGLHALDSSTTIAALGHRLPEVRQQAVSLAALDWRDQRELRAACLRLANDEDMSVRFRLARALGQIEGSEKLPALLALAGTADADGWLARALSATAADVAPAFLRALGAQKSSWFTTPAPAQLEALEQLGESAGRSDQGAMVDELLDLKPGHTELAPGQLAILAGIATARYGRGQPPSGAAQSADVGLSPRMRGALGFALAGSLNSTAQPATRALAIRIVRDLGMASDVARLAPLVADAGPVGDAAVTAICRRGDAAALQALFDGWGGSTPGRRRLLASAALESATATRAFVEALERQAVQPAEIDPALRTAMTKNRDPDLASRAERVFSAAAPAPRDEVLSKYQAALELTANRERGAALFKAHCHTCHKMFGLGRQVGPDLSGVAGRAKETLLADLLDPSRQVAPDYLSYNLITRDGRVLAGILVSDTETALTVRRGEGADDVVAKSDIEELSAAGKSLMPEGFEQRLSVQDVADVLGFLGLPERKLLEQP